VESSKEVCLDVIPIPIINLNALEQITNSKAPHLVGPFSFPLGMSSPNFKSVHPLLFTPTHPTNFTLPFRKPLGWHSIALPLSWLSIVREKVDSKKWLHAYEHIFSFTQCFLAFFDSFHFQRFVDFYVILVCRSILRTR
jgi:hypothetical protein